MLKFEINSKYIIVRFNTTMFPLVDQIYTHIFANCDYDSLINSFIAGRGLQHILLDIFRCGKHGSDKDMKRIISAIQLHRNCPGPYEDLLWQYAKSFTDLSNNMIAFKVGEYGDFDTIFIYARHADIRIVIDHPPHILCEMIKPKQFGYLAAGAYVGKKGNPDNLHYKYILELFDKTKQDLSGLKYPDIMDKAFDSALVRFRPDIVSDKIKYHYYINKPTDYIPRIASKFDKPEILNLFKTDI